MGESYILRPFLHFPLSKDKKHNVFILGKFNKYYWGKNWREMNPNAECVS